MTDTDHSINICDFENWEYIQYPCPIKMVRDFVRIMFLTWQKIALPADEANAQKPIFGYRRALADRVITEMINSIPEDYEKYLFYMWMDGKGKIHFFHMTHEDGLESGIYRPELEKSFLDRKPAAVLQFNACASLCNVCTIWPLTQDLYNGTVYPIAEGYKLYPQAFYLQTILEMEDGDFVTPIDGKVTTVPDIMSPCEFRTFYRWRTKELEDEVEYLYIYCNTSPTMVHFVDWALDMIMVSPQSISYKNMIDDIMKGLRAKRYEKSSS